MCAHHLTLASVIRVHIHVRSSEVPPLKAINRTQVSLLPVVKAAGVQKLAGRVRVPDLDALLAELLGVGRAADEPEQLLHHRAPKNSLRRQEWKCACNVYEEKF